MNTVKITFRGGGITGFGKYKKPEKGDAHPVILSQWSECEKNGEPFKILRDEALKGVLCYLSGYVDKISNINDTEIDQAIASKKVFVSSAPFFDFMTTRYRSSNAKYPSVNMKGLTLDNAKDSMRLCKAEISQVFGTNDLETIYNIVNSKAPVTQTVQATHIKTAQSILFITSNLPGKFWKKTTERIVDFIQWAQNASQLSPPGLLKHKTASAGFFTEDTLKVYDLIAQKAAKDTMFVSDMQDASLTFLPSTPQSKDYVDLKTNPPEYLTSGAAFLLKCDFDVFLTVSGDLLKKMTLGPGSAFWGHGGVVEFSLVNEDEIPVDTAKDVVYNIPVKKEKK